MTGRHSGKSSLRWQVFLAVLADLVGRGYTGQHRLDAARTVAPVRVDLLPRQRPMPVFSLVPTPSARPDRFADTAPHPVVKLFPMPVASSPEEDSRAELSNATA